MPPNRKAKVVLLECDLPSIDITQLKLLPHTTETTISATYWDWPTDEHPEIQRIQQEEKIRQSLYVSRIEENLVKEAQRLSLIYDHQEEDRTNAAHDDHWHMPHASLNENSEKENDNDDNTNNSGQQDQQERMTRASANFWYWPCVVAQNNERLIHRVLEEERAQWLTSSVFLEKSLVEAAAVAGTALTSSTSLDNAHDSYWDHY